MNNLFFNRELSWLSFNERVLFEAEDNDVPLLEKLKFLGIFTSNLDEFFMIRVAGIKDQIKSDLQKPDLSGLTPTEQLKKINKKICKLLPELERIYQAVSDELMKHKIFLKSKNFDQFPIDSLFFNEILPQISPITISPSNPFPFIHNLGLNIFSKIKNSSDSYNSIIIIPNSIKRFYTFQDESGIYIFLLEDIISHFLQYIYKDSELMENFIFRITRNADLNFNNDEVEDLYNEIKSSLNKRIIGEPVRIEIMGNFSEDSKHLLQSYFRLDEIDTYKNNQIIDYKFLISIDLNIPQLKYKKLVQHIPNYIEKENIFKTLKKRDILLIRPYNEFYIISNLVSQAAEDPEVIAIKMTLYRANRDSSILKPLEKAALAGKHVCVVIELKARFDEERNLEWAERLEKAGCIVTYGFVDLKIHAKALLIVRRENNRIVRYTHLSTGNYNEITANLYTDIDFLTSDEVIGNDTVKLFNYLMSYSDPFGWEKLVTAPKYIRNKLIKLIDNEISYAKKGKPARIIAKLNSLYDKELTLKLYEASQSGVKIDLIIRGITSVIPGLKGISDNITIKSIIGRFLEHPRVIYFQNGGNYSIYLSTADWMVRNLDRRVEILFEIEDPENKKLLLDYLMLNIKDNQK
ncbi:MAG: polyphosphate kinase 1, partial [Deferribacterales bacterium]